jgi:GNAT superfamily N-acetyltransferase
MDDPKRRILAGLPDAPRWVGTRDLLSRADSRLSADEHGFVVWSDRQGLGAVVGRPAPAGVAEAASARLELLAFPENVDAVRSALREFSAERATILAAPGRPPRSPGHPSRVVTLGDIPSLGHVPDDLKEELADAAGRGRTVVAALDGRLPVAFAYAAAETETLWDVSIDTVESHRRRGYAAAAVRSLMGLMKHRGKRAVWGALESNPASLSLARKLGFVEVDELWVLRRGLIERARRS